MALFKILKGDSSRISTDVTPFNDGYAYFTPDDGGFYIDSADGETQRRIRINPEYENKHTTKSLTLLASAWVGSEPPYTQTILVGGVLSSSSGIISLAHSATTDQRETAREALINIIGQEDGKLIFSADGKLPNYDIPANLILFNSGAPGASHTAAVVVDYFEVTLPTEWIGEQAPYTQSVQVNGITPEHHPTIGLIAPSDFSRLETHEKEWAKIYDVETSDNALIFYAKDVTTIELNLQVKDVNLNG